MRRTDDQVNSLLPPHIRLKSGTYKHTNKKACFIDEIYGEWWATPWNVIKGGNHPLRARANGAAKSQLSVEEAKKRLPVYLSIDENTYVNASTKCRFIDEIYGEWWATPRDAFSGYSHPERGREVSRKKRTLPVEDIKKRLPSCLKLDETTYKNVNVKCKFIDSTYGDFWAVPNSILYNGANHPKRGIANSIKKHTTPIEELKLRLPPYIKIDESTFVRQRTKCKFIDDVYGEWWTTPDGVLRGKDHPKRALDKIKQTNIAKFGVDNAAKSSIVRNKIEQTNLKRYGHKTSSQNLEVARKNARSQTKRVIKHHWKTNEEIVCVGSYEVLVIDYFNTNKMDYAWQPQVFKMPTGKVYIPDCYLPIEDKWVEIKGRFLGDAKEKWDWFHSTYPNSELWDRPKLKSMGLKAR